MLLPSIRRLALADINADTLRDLVEHGEDLLVERKRQPPKPPRFGATVTSFANTLGGWVLLGVDDDKTIVGYAKPDRLDLQSHLAELLRQEADPLPPFVAEMRELDGKGIGVIRVFESADAPHIVRGTGGVYVRTSKGKQPVDDHRTLLELAKRGDDAEHDARRRLRDLPLIGAATGAPDSAGSSRGGQLIRAIVRAAPLTVTPQFTDWPISEAGAQWCANMANRLGGEGADAIIPQARGVIAMKRRYAATGSSPVYWRATVAADSAGAVAATLTDAATAPVAQLHQLRRSWFRPLLHAVSETLQTCEAYGRTALDAWLSLPGNVHIEDEPERQAQHPDMARTRHVAGELTIPADDDEIAALGRQWERELARSFQIQRWEDGTA